MEQLVLQLFALFSPIVQAIIKKHKNEHSEAPTDEQILAEFRTNIRTYLGEGQDWKDSKGRT